MFNYTLSINLKNNLKHIQILHQTITVDKELNKHVERKIELDGNNMFVKFKCDDLRQLRASVCGLIDQIKLTVSTIERFEKF